MTRSRRLLTATLLTLGFGPWTGMQAQDCLNESLWPSNAVTPDALGEVTTISTCSYQEEYSQITAVVAGGNYAFTCAANGYITVRQGTYDGPVLGQGSGTLEVTAATAEDLFAHWNVDEQCGTGTDCVTTTVQFILNCTPGQATYTFTEDCDAQTYAILLNITSIGDAASVDVEVDVAGNITLLEDLGVGEVELGPFGLTETPAVRLIHDADPMCHRIIPITGFHSACPLMITCGAAPITQEYCYTNNDAMNWLYSASGPGTMRLKFLRGTIESSNYDDIRIYDGTDNTGTLLFEHTATARRNLGPVGSAILDPAPIYYGVDVFATSGSIFMEMSSDGSVNCGATEYDPWEWTVVCLDCEIPNLSYTVVDDCANDEYTIALDVSALGDASSLTLSYVVNDGDPQTVENVGLGMTEIGPFAASDTVDMVAIHSGSDLCNIELANITSTGTCPLLIDCGTEVSDSLCYGNLVDQRYYYQGTGSYPLAVYFDAGELLFGDTITIFDGGDITAPRLFQGTSQMMTGGFYYTTNPEHRLTIRVTSNQFTSCQDGGTTTPLEWRISCLDCVHPTAQFNIVQDCANYQYFVDVVVTDLGSDPMPVIVNSVNSDSLEITTVGTHQVGPFVSGTPVQVTIVNDMNPLCNVYSATLVNPLCPVMIDCPGPTLEETYCYVANDNHAWAYELVGGGSATLKLTFIRGTIESNSFDRLRIYDGADNTAPLLFEHSASSRRHLGPEGSALTDPSPVYYGVDVAATGGRLYMEMTSDGSVQCGTDQFDEWEWEVYCLDCTNPTVTFNIVENCVAREYSTEVIITDAGADDPLSATNLVTGEVVADLGVGVHTFGPYPVDSTSVFRVFNQAYEQCRATSDTLVFAADSCINVTCGFENTTLCYGNNADRWYTWRSAQNVPLTLAFLGGQMLAGDYIEVFNGGNETAPQLYTGNNGGNFAGFAIPSSNADNMLTLHIVSNGAGSCEDGGVNNPLQWTVACGGVGINEADVDLFSLFPNPTNGQLTIRMAAAKAQVHVLDMSGRVVLERTIAMNGTLDLSQLTNGNYMVQVITNDRVQTKRVELIR